MVKYELKLIHTFFLKKKKKEVLGFRSEIINCKPRLAHLKGFILFQYTYLFFSPAIITRSRLGTFLATFLMCAYMLIFVRMSLMWIVRSVKFLLFEMTIALQLYAVVVE